MTTLTNKFPTFEANQVLTNAHLNQLFQYLDEQNRITRSSLIGVGIVCGFELKVNGTTVTISNGCGISSEGYLISEFTSIDFVGYKNYTLPVELAYPTFKDSASPFTQYPLIELLAAGEPGAQVLTANILANKAVVLFLELKKDGLRNCSPNNCDDKGAEVTAIVRPLLINRADLDKVIAKSSPAATTTDIENNLLARLNLPDIALPRVDVLSTELKTSNSLIQAIRSALGANLVLNLSNAFVAATEAFKPLLGDISFAMAQAKLNIINTEINSGNKITYIQNYYDFIDDLIKAYDELRWSGLDLLCRCNPADVLFPRHLMLGLTNPASVTNPQYYRNRFLASPALASCEEQTENLALLFKRVLRMIESFNSQPALHSFADNVADKQIRITPSKLGDIALSQKAIPYYYENTVAKTPVYKLWSVEKTHRNRSILNLSYRSFDYPSVSIMVLDALKYELEPYNFLRIEGHLNKPKQAVMETLYAYKAKYRLPIEIIALETGEIRSKSPYQEYFNNLKDFLVQHPGVQHKSGVPMGGTFIVICHGHSDNENIIGGGSLLKDMVIADFYLPYPVLVKEELSGQRLVKECAYAWIDSIKHMHNLMLRAYRLNKTNKAAAATEFEKSRLSNSYIVRIYKYEIQGVDLLENSYLDVAIPISRLKTQGLNAIAAELNKRFPQGVVFDCMESSNHLVIRYLEGHSFRVELGGLQGNQIRYAYSNDGLSRWQNIVWEPFNRQACCASPCKVIGGKYEAKDYEWLHSNYPALLRNGLPLPTTDDLIQWEKLILRRSRLIARKKSPLPIKTLLEKILRYIKEIDPNAQVLLVGSWANGSWVSSERLENVASFAGLLDANSQFEAAYRTAFGEFLLLREKVTGKSSKDFSDIDLLIDSQLDFTADMINVPSAYKVNFIKGKADAQKGLVIEGK